VGGEVRGNYATWNAVNKSANTTLSNGNLNATSAVADWRAVLGTIGMTSGKWYWELTITGASYHLHGIAKQGANLDAFIGTDANGWGYYGSSGTYNNSNYINTGSFASYTTGDVIGVAFDADNGSLYFYKNGTVQNSGSAAYTGLTSGPYFPAVSHFNSTNSDANFGQRAFAYTAPSGFKALCTQNLPAPLVTKSNEVMDAVLYTGNSGSQAITLPGGFSPDLVWLKSRSNAYYNHLIDTVRGSNKVIWSNLTDAETTSGTEITSFNSDGFTLGSGTGVNGSGSTYVGWCWDAGTSTVTNNSGSISSQVRANATAGFSVVTWTSPSSGDYTIGHGLGVAPSLVITKSRSAGGDQWYTFHRSVCTTTSNYLKLVNTDALSTFAGAWGATLPTSTVVGLNAGGGFIPSSATAVAYCFSPVVGYSSFGSYTGNGSADGPFIYTGMRSRFLLYKRSDVSNDWYIMDTARDTYNVSGTRLYPNLSNAEFVYTATDLLDVTANGFKIRSSNAAINASGGTYIYAAFAEAPFNYSRAR
jgi:hypothetical protein